MSSIDFVGLLCFSEISTYVLLGFISAHTIGKHLEGIDKYAFVWYTFNLLIHALLEGRFVYYHFTGTVGKQTGFLSEIWKEYAHADTRWGVIDGGIASVELAVVFLCIPLCVLVMYGMLHQKYWRHFAQIVLCVSELYGGWMTFGPEWVIGSPNLNTSTFMYKWVYLFFFNFLWVIIPSLLLYQSFREYSKAFKYYNILNMKSPRRSKNISTPNSTSSSSSSSSSTSSSSTPATTSSRSLSPPPTPTGRRRSTRTNVE